jgi:hypothetical protein
MGLAALMAFTQPGARAQAAPAQPTPNAVAANRQAETAFLRADTNGDGKLSRQEAERLPAIAAHFDQLDTNHDQFLSLEEFNKVSAL